MGRAWTEDELRRIGDICLRHNVVVVADEIHADFARAGHVHVPYASLGERYAKSAVVCTAPSKTFNLAGLQLSNIFIPNPDLRAAFRRTLDRTGYDEPSVFGVVATRACYEQGGNGSTSLRACSTRITPCSKRRFHACRAWSSVPLESTYLPWLDCRGLGLNDDELKRLVEKEAKLWLDMGTMFGPEGAGFVRVNLASPKAMIEDACSRLERAVTALGE